jgi:hypothetical protein
MGLLCLHLLDVEGRPERCSSSTPSLPPLNTLCHLRTWHEHKTASPSAVLNCNVSEPDFQGFTQNVIAKRCSKLFCVIARDNAQKLLRTFLTYRPLQRRGLNWGSSNCIAGLPLRLSRQSTFISSPFCAAQNTIIITFGTDHV